MTNREVLAVIQEVLAAALAVEPEAVAPEARIMDDLNAESIDLLDLRFRIEKAFGIRISADDLAVAFRGVGDAATFRARFTVGALCDYVAARVAEGPA